MREKTIKFLKTWGIHAASVVFIVFMAVDNHGKRVIEKAPMPTWTAVLLSACGVVIAVFFAYTAFRMRRELRDMEGLTANMDNMLASIKAEDAANVRVCLALRDAAEHKVIPSGGMIDAEVVNAAWRRLMLDVATTVETGKAPPNPFIKQN